MKSVQHVVENQGRVNCQSIAEIMAGGFKWCNQTGYMYAEGSDI